jgi:hypothetical protein
MSRPTSRDALALATAALLGAGCSSGPGLWDTTGNAAPPKVALAGDAGSPPVDAAPAVEAASADTSSGDASAPDPVEAGPPAAPLCELSSGWSPVARVASVPAAGFGAFAGISASELTVAWRTTSGAISVADRASRSEDFGPASLVDTGSAALADDRAALDSAGTILYLVRADRSTFLAFERSPGATTWSASLPNLFANVAAMTADGGGTLSEPVLGADGVSLYYLVTLAGSVPGLFESTWDAPDHVWRTGVALANPELSSVDATHRRRPTGASSDGLTLFFFDEVAGTERAAWRDYPASVFTSFADLPGVPEAAPNARCGTLYYQATDATGGGVFIAQ